MDFAVLVCNLKRAVIGLYREGIPPPDKELCMVVMDAWQQSTSPDVRVVDKQKGFQAFGTVLCEKRSIDESELAQTFRNACTQIPKLFTGMGSPRRKTTG